MTLYELTGAFLELQSMMEDPDADEQMILDTMESLDYDIEDKANGYAKVIQNLKGAVTAIKAEKERLRNRQVVLENNIKRLTANLQNAMDATGKRKFKTDLFTFSIQQNGGKLPVILDVEEDKLPKTLMRVRYEPDMEKIRERLDSGKACRWAHYGDRGESLRIR